MIVGLVAIRERGVGAGIIAVRLAQRRGGDEVPDADGVGLAQRPEEAVRVAIAPQGFRVAQMRMRIHQPDLSTEEGGAFGSSEISLHAAAIFHRPVEQPSAVGRQQITLDQSEMLTRLLRREEARDDRMDHRQQAVADAGLLVARMQQIFDAIRVAERGEPRDHAVGDQEALEILPHAQGLCAKIGGPSAQTQAQIGLGERDASLEMQRHGPGTAKAFAHARVGGLHRVVPIAVAIDRKMRAGDRAAPDEIERPLDVYFDRRPLRCFAFLREERRVFVEKRAIARTEEVSRQRQQRPERDVAMGILGAVASLPLEDAEELWPVAIWVLLVEQAQQQVAQRGEFTEGEKHLGGALAHVAGAPGAAGELF